MKLANLQHFLVCVAFWSSTWIGITFQLGTVAPEVSVFWRFGIASAVCGNIIILGEPKGDILFDSQLFGIKLIRRAWCCDAGVA